MNDVLIEDIHVDGVEERANVREIEDVLRNPVLENLPDPGGFDRIHKGKQNRGAKANLVGF